MNSLLRLGSFGDVQLLFLDGTWYKRICGYPAWWKKVEGKYMPCDNPFQTTHNTSEGE